MPTHHSLWNPSSIFQISPPSILHPHGLSSNSLSVFHLHLKKIDLEFQKLKKRLCPLQVSGGAICLTYQAVQFLLWKYLYFLRSEMSIKFWVPFIAMHLFIYLFIFIERCAAGCKNVDWSEKWKSCESAFMSKTKKYMEKLKVIFF